MSAPSPDPNHNGWLTRRSVFIGAAASVLCVPAIVRATSLMPVRGMIMPVERLYAGFVDRLLYDGCDKALKAGRIESTFFVNDRKLSEAEMRRIVAYARSYGFLK